jgi:hypothetical protein
MRLKTSRDMPQNVPSCGKLYSDYRTTDRENLTRHLIFAPVHVEHPVKIYDWPQDQDHKQSKAAKIMSVLEAALELVAEDDFKKE